MSDWLSEIEAWEKREHDEDIKLMARVIRELAGHIKTLHQHVWVDKDKLSPDAKELLESQRP